MLLTDRAEESSGHFEEREIVFLEQHLSLVGQCVGQHGGAEPHHKVHVVYIP